MARVNIKLHYTMNKAKFPMQKHYYGLRAQDPKLYGTHWFCKHDKPLQVRLSQDPDCTPAPNVPE